MTSATKSARGTTPPPATARLSVDWTRCDGHGLCHALLAQRIEVDEWGFPIVRDPHVSGHELDVRRAIAACPALALHLTR